MDEKCKAANFFQGEASLFEMPSADVFFPCKRAKPQRHEKER